MLQGKVIHIYPSPHLCERNLKTPLLNLLDNSTPRSQRSCIIKNRFIFPWGKTWHTGNRFAPTKILIIEHQNLGCNLETMINNPRLRCPLLANSCQTSGTPESVKLQRKKLQKDKLQRNWKTPRYMVRRGWNGRRKCPFPPMNRHPQTIT